MFENLRRGRQARNFATNVSKILDLKSSSEQILFRKLPLGAPVVICNAFFARGVVTYIGYTVRAGTFWSEIGYGSCTLVLNWVCFFEEATSSSLDDKIISFLMFTPTLYVP